MLVELLRPTGPELARRLVAALSLVPESDREELVAEIERRIAEAYPPGEGPSRTVTHVSAPTQRAGFVEEIHTTYEVKPGGSSSAGA